MKNKIGFVSLRRVAIIIALPPSDSAYVGKETNGFLNLEKRFRERHMFLGKRAFDFWRRLQSLFFFNVLPTSSYYFLPVRRDV